jgi:error-prone DNA polymerase
VYVPLYVKSHFSFLEGASSPEELVEHAHGLGLPALALTDRDGVYGIVRAHMKAKALGMPLIVGAEITLGLGASDAKVIVLARDRPGYAGLCRLISLGRARCPKGSARVIADELRAITGGVVVLTRDTRVFSLVKSRFGDDAYALLTRHLGPDEPEQELALRSAATSAGLPLVAAMEVLYHDRARRRLQDLVTCIRHGRTLAGAGTCIHPNAEHDMLDVAAMRARFVDVPDALERTLEVAERCTFRMSELKYTYPSEKLPDGRTEHEHLTILANEGARRRYGSVIPEAARAQLDKELLLIGDLEYDGYFLTMHEIVAYCGIRGILCQGRGSAANSVGCYVLGVTAVDPIEGELLFERFLSRERAEPPDIDLDIEHERREEVIQHVYARFGRALGDGGEPHPLQAALGGARRGQGARDPDDEDRRHRAHAQPLRGRHPEGGPHRGGPRPMDARAHEADVRTVPGDPRCAAAPLDPSGRLFARARACRCVRADRARDDGTTHRHPVGQIRRRGARALQGRSARSSARSP